MSGAPQNTNLETESRLKLAVLFSLIVTTCLGSFGQITLATLSGIIGAKLTAVPQLATVPVTAGIIGVAAAAWPMAQARKHFGDRLVFTLGLLWAGAGALLNGWAISNASFIGYCAGCFMMGNNLALVAQYRFAAAALVPQHYVSRAVSGLMVGTLVAAVVAPWFALRNRFWLEAEFAGSFIALAIISVITAVMMALLPLSGSPSETRTVKEAERPLRQLLQNRTLQIAMVSAAAGYGVMSLIMTATPISMHVMDGHSAEATANAIRMHILAMFLPSLITGWLVARFGIRRMLWTGVALQILCVAIATSGQTAWHYQGALIALGAGWNLLFIGGTTLIATECATQEGPRIQGINDFVVFGAMAISSISAGSLLYFTGWVWTNLAALLLIGLIVATLLRARR
jgi:MFS family permease